MRAPRSLRARVALTALASVAVVLVTAGVSLLLATERDGRRAVDRELHERYATSFVQARANKAAPAKGKKPALVPPDKSALPAAKRAPAETTPQNTDAALLRGSGSFTRVVLGRTVLKAAGDLPPAGTTLPSNAGLHTITIAGSAWRLYNVELPEPAGATAQLAQTLAPVSGRVAQTRTLLLELGALALALSAALAWVLSRTALRPLASVAAAASRVSSTQDLHQRLPQGRSPAEVQDLTSSLNQMLARLERSATDTERALAATRRFAADAGHELRTPLMSLKASLRAITHPRGLSQGERERALADIAHEEARVVALLDALQALARADSAAALSYEKVDLLDIVEEALERARRRYPEQDLRLAAEVESAPVEGSPDGLRALVDNLLENSVRHGGTSTVVEVASIEEGKSVVLQVDDDGPGVPRTEREHIFDRFARGSAVRTPGSGLGLAIVAQQARNHDGEVTVEDSPLGGARFRVRLRRSDS